MRDSPIKVWKGIPWYLKALVVVSVVCVALIILTVVTIAHASEVNKLLKQAEAAEPTMITIPSENGKTELTIAQIAETLEIASDLVTTRYRYTDVNVYEKTATFFNIDTPFKDKTVYTYNGEILAGIDLSKVTIDLDTDKEVITLGLPNAKQISHEVDEKSFQFYDVKKTVFVSTSLEEYSELRDTMKTEKEVSLRAAGFFDDVKKDAKKVLMDILRANESTKDYDIQFRDIE